MTCTFCQKPIYGWAIAPVYDSRKPYHLYLNDEGQACPKGKNSCWERSDHGKLSLAEYEAKDQPVYRVPESMNPNPSL